jgi:hypothetical protein
VLTEELKKEVEEGESGETYADFILESQRWKNFGFKELRILDGNIGYLELRTFFPFNAG